MLQAGSAVDTQAKEALFTYFFEDTFSLVTAQMLYHPVLTHCILNRLSHTIYWKSPISILGTSGYEINIFLEKIG